MNVYESKARLLFARERVELLASEMQAARRAQPSRSACRKAAGFLGHLRRPGFVREQRNALISR